MHTGTPPETPAQSQSGRRTRQILAGSALAAVVALVIAGALILRGRSPIHSVVGLDSPVASVAAGSSHTCALTAGGGVKCWGENYFGQLGDGTTDRRSSPVDVAGLAEGVVSIAAGGNQSCAITAERALKCWGGYEYHAAQQLAKRISAYPADVAGFEDGVKSVALGGSGNACAITSDGAVKCWGGELGVNLIEISGLGAPAVSIAVGGFHACAVLNDGGVACWGGNNVGQTGSSYTPWETKDPNAPVSRVRGFEGAIQIAAGHLFTVVLIDDGSVLYWGQISPGYGNEADLAETAKPRAVGGLSQPARAVGAAGHHACAITGDGVECWGGNMYGELGDLDYWGDSPVFVEMKGAVSVAAGGDHSCAVTRAGEVKCWGYNGVGQLGTGEFD